jgi:hypothetical protein
VQSHSFEVTTLVDGKPPTEDAILAYKQKIGKQNDGGDWGLQFRHQTVGWHSALPVPRVEYNRTVRSVNLYSHQLVMVDGAIIEWDILVNTIPLPAFLKLCVISPPVHEEFRSDPIYMATMSALAPVDGMTLNYISDAKTDIYRETFSGAKVFVETLTPLKEAAKLMPGKIHPHSENEAILRKLKVFDTYCFGRYATWRPDELGHQTWKQIELWRNR